VVWDKETGRPVYNAIVWQCRRSTEISAQLKRDGHEEYIRETTGLVTDPTSPAPRSGSSTTSKVRERAERGELLFGTIDTWLIWKFSGGKVHVTDYTNASRTMIFNIHTLEWDEKLLDILGIPRQMLPKCARRRKSTATPRAASPSRYRRRPASGAVRPDVRGAGPGQEHLRHRLLPADEHRRQGGEVVPRPAHHHRLRPARRSGLRPGRRRVQRRLHRAVAAR
jgi:hypothetical protein